MFKTRQKIAISISMYKLDTGTKEMCTKPITHTIKRYKYCGLLAMQNGIWDLFK